jgi:hypothetical protein
MAATGVFGNWGQPSGVNSSGISYGSNSFGTIGDTSSNYSDDFIIDYDAPIAHKRSRMRERLYHLQAKDHTYVQPKVHYKVNMDGQEFYPRQEFFNK